MKHLHLDEIESVPLLGGELQWKPVRHELGIDAFGVNVDRGGRRRPGRRGARDDHQERYAVVSGVVRLRCGSGELDAPAGSLV